jgi:tetratricopeptide (TPR) repeat protein
MRPNNKHIYKILVLSFLFFTISKSYSQNNKSLFDSANYQYSKGNYDKAIQLYERIVNNNVEAPELYFNLGNAFYKTNRIGWAVLYYEKAKKLSPKDEDVENNLTLAALKTEDKINPLPQLFIAEWINGVTDLMSEKNWSITCISALCISLLFFALYFSSVVTIFKKIFFYSAFITLIIAITTFFLAQHKCAEIKNNNYAVVIAPTTTINSSPAEKSTKLFILHEGTKVKITDEDSGWIEIKLANGNVGWVKKKDIARI